MLQNNDVRFPNSGQRVIAIITTGGKVYTTGSTCWVQPGSPLVRLLRRICRWGTKSKVWPGENEVFLGRTDVCDEDFFPSAAFARFFEVLVDTASFVICSVVLISVGAASMRVVRFYAGSAEAVLTTLNAHWRTSGYRTCYVQIARIDDIEEQLFFLGYSQ